MSTFPPLTPPATPFTPCKSCGHIHRVGDACVTTYTRS